MRRIWLLLCPIHRTRDQKRLTACASEWKNKFQRTKTWSRNLGKLIDLVILDEAHKVKIQLSQGYRVIQALQPRFIVSLKATPMINSPADLKGLMELMPKKKMNKLRKALWRKIRMLMRFSPIIKKNPRLTNLCHVQPCSGRQLGMEGSANQGQPRVYPPSVIAKRTIHSCIDGVREVFPHPQTAHE